MCVCVCVCVWRGGLCVCARMWPQLRVLCMCRVCVPVCVYMCHLPPRRRKLEISVRLAFSLYLHTYIRKYRERHAHLSPRRRKLGIAVLSCNLLPLPPHPILPFDPPHPPPPPPTPADAFFSRAVDQWRACLCVCVCLVCVCVCVHAKTYANA